MFLFWAPQNLNYWEHTAVGPCCLLEIGKLFLSTFRWHAHRNIKTPWLFQLPRQQLKQKGFKLTEHSFGLITTVFNRMIGIRWTRTGLSQDFQNGQSEVSLFALQLPADQWIQTCPNGSELYKTHPLSGSNGGQVGRKCSQCVGPGPNPAGLDLRHPAGTQAVIISNGKDEVMAFLSSPRHLSVFILLAKAFPHR